MTTGIPSVDLADEVDLSTLRESRMSPLWGGSGRRALTALGLGLMAVVSCSGNVDKDADGFFSDSALCSGPLYDCDDEDRSVGAGERLFADCDDDGYGDPDVPVYACAEEPLEECEALVCPAYAPNALDCNDLLQGDEPGVLVYPDCDGDDLGDPARSILFCFETDPVPMTDFSGAQCPYVLNSGDCDDTESIIKGGDSYWWDCDEDTFGDAIRGPVVLCQTPSTAVETTCDLVTQPGDCDDENAEVAPAVGEDPATVDCGVVEEEEGISAADLQEYLGRLNP